MTKLRCVPVSWLNDWFDANQWPDSVPPPPADIAEALELAKDIVPNNGPMRATIAELRLARALLKSWGRE